MSNAEKSNLNHGSFTDHSRIIHGSSRFSPFLTEVLRTVGLSMFITVLLQYPTISSLIILSSIIVHNDSGDWLQFRGHLEASGNKRSSGDRLMGLRHSVIKKHRETKTTIFSQDAGTLEQTCFDGVCLTSP